MSGFANAAAPAAAAPKAPATAVPNAPVTTAAPTSMSGFAKAAAPVASTSMSGFANAPESTDADTQNYQRAFANPPQPASNSIVDDIKGVGSSLLGQNIIPTARNSVPAQLPFADLFAPTKQVFEDTFNAAAKTYTQINTAAAQPTLGGRVAGLTQGGLDAINTAFQPITTLMGEAAKLPGTAGDVAGYVNNIFAHVGVLGGDTLATYVQKGPFSDSQKATLAPLAQQIGALGLQIVVGEVGHEAFSGLKVKTKSFLSTLAEDSRIKALQNNPDLQAAIQKNVATPPEVHPYEGAVLKPGTPESKAALEASMPGGSQDTNVPTPVKSPESPAVPLKPGTPESKAALEAGMPEKKGDTPKIGTDTTTPETTVYNGNNKVTTETTKTYGKTLSFENDQQDVIKTLADQGDTRAQALIDEAGKGSKVPYAKADQFLQDKYGKDYDAIEYKNSQDPTKGIEYHDLGEGKFYSKNKLTADTYAMQTARGVKYGEASKQIRADEVAKLGPEKARPIEQIQAETEGKQVPSTRGEDVLNAGVEKGILPETGELPTHEQMSVAAEDAKANDYIDKNHEEALSSVLDTSKSEEPFTESVYKNLETKAVKEGDIDTMRKLAQSDVPTKAGQRLKMLDSNDPNNPVKIMRDINKTLEKNAGGEKKVTGVKKLVQKEGNKVLLPKEDLSWNNFLDKIEIC